jgi:EAL domain-containing protein (putative c-di-GMP-specific phosphodiesterase class I)
LVSLLAGASAHGVGDVVEGRPVPSPLSLAAIDNWVGGLVVLVIVYPLLRFRRAAIERETALRVANVRLDDYRRLEREEQAATRRAAAAIRRCLSDRSMTILFQPIVSTHDGRVVGAEALARFDDGRPPDLWFKDAADAGLGIELELLAVEVALTGAAQLPDDVYVSVNVSAETMASPRMRSLLELHRRPFVVELTEHAPIEHSKSLADALRWVRLHGGRVAADDAGNGYAGLSHLLRLAPDIIKLDRELVTGLDRDPAKRALVHAVTGFAADSSRDVVVIAEGVETREELDALVSAGVTAVQGYFLGRPTELPLETVRYPELTSPTVVVVEDDPSVHRTLSLILGRSGFDVVASAHDGPTAMTLVAEARPDAVVLDYSLAAMTGSEVLEQIRSSSPATVVVGFSATGPDAFRIALDGFVSKTDFDGLLNLPGLLRECIARRAATTTRPHLDAAVSTIGLDQRGVIR